MSAVLSANQICETALRAIGAFPVTESAADGEQLREAMKWLDLILGQNAGGNRLLFLLPAAESVQFTLTNGTESYDLTGALGANAPADGMQFPVAAYLVVPTGNSVLAFSAPIPAGVVAGQAVSDLNSASAIPPGTTVVSINNAANQVTISSPSTCASGHIIQFGSPSVAQLATTGTVAVANGRAGVATFYRRPVDIVTRDHFLNHRHPGDSNGHPRQVYIDRLPDNQLYLYPFPSSTDSNLYILELDVQTYAPNVAPAGVTGTQPQSQVLTKFRQAWQRYLCAQLAHDLGTGPIFKLSEARLNRFGSMASAAKNELEAFENREHDNEPPICHPYDHAGWHHHRHHDYDIEMH